MEDARWSVYMHTNRQNGKRYIGITSQLPEKRWLNGYGYSEKLPFGRAIRKYGWDNFDHYIIADKLFEKDAKNMEVRLIRELHTQDDAFGYNVTNGGDGISGLHHTEESKAKMSEAKSGERHPNYGKHLPLSTRLKIAEKLTGNTNPLGIIRSDETKEKMSRAKRKPVAMCVEDEVVQVFDSAKSAELSTGISRKNISQCCKNMRKHAGGYAWKFA